MAQPNGLTKLRAEIEALKAEIKHKNRQMGGHMAQHNKLKAIIEHKEKVIETLNGRANVLTNDLIEVRKHLAKLRRTTGDKATFYQRGFYVFLVVSILLWLSLITR